MTLVDLVWDLLRMDLFNVLVLVLDITNNKRVLKTKILNNVRR